MNTAQKTLLKIPDIEVFIHPTNPSKTVYRTDSGVNCPDGYKRIMLSKVHEYYSKI